MKTTLRESYIFARNFVKNPNDKHLKYVLKDRGINTNKLLEEVDRIIDEFTCDK